MNQLSARLQAGILCCLLCASANASSKDDDDGRYEGVQASENAVWVVDTRTGKVRKCTQDFADQTPVCSKESN